MTERQRRPSAETAPRYAIPCTGYTACTMPNNPVSEPPHKDSKDASPKSVSIIFNPVSGQSDPEERKKIISDALAEHGYTGQFIATSKEEGAKALAEKALKDGVDLLVVSGGDGTVMEAMSALVGTDTPIAVLPAGTGNLLSVNLGIPTTVPDAVHVALSGHVYKLDLAKTGDGRFFAIMGGIGMDAQVIKDADREAKDKLGVFAYFWSALKNLKRRRARFEIQLDDAPALSRRAKTVLIANMGKMTGGIEAMPTASPDDGFLDVGIVRTQTAGQWLRLLGYALLGRAQDDPGLEVFQARRIKITAPFPEPIQFDGEDGGRTRDLSIEIVPQAVGILLPEGAPAARDTEQPPAVVAQKNARRFLPLAVLVFGAVALIRHHRNRNRRKPSNEDS